jgi:hypothetical protein
MAGSFWPCATDFLVKENRIALAMTKAAATLCSLKEGCTPRK